MTRDIWYASKQFFINRFINNFTHAIIMKVQDTQNALAVFMVDHPHLGVTDKYSLVERQLRIVSLEADKLREMMNRLTRSVEPLEFDDFKLSTAIKNTDEQTP